MKKPFNVLTSAALTAAFVSTSIIPVSAAEVEQAQYEVTDIIVTNDDGDFLKLSKEVFNEAIVEGFVTADNVTHLIVNDKIFTKELYNEALVEKNGNKKEIYELIEQHEETDLPVKDGQFENGSIVPKEDEQPEDRLNETLVYNFAA